MSNLIIMGPPGAGKTSVSKILGQKLNIPVIDIDDVLEQTWQDTVANKLNELGDKKFLEAEGEVLLTVKAQNSVISLTGSNPLHEAAINYMRQIGTIIFLDVPVSIISQRLNEMKVDRIVGMKTESITDILHYRQQFYEKYYDIRVSFYNYQTIEKMAYNVILHLQKNEKFVSTRDNTRISSNFQQVVKTGLAPDGGLFVPVNLPALPNNIILSWLNLSYQEIATRVIEKFPMGKIKPQAIKKMVDKAYANFNHPQITPVKKIAENQFLLELFHGETASFKDMALQLTPQFFTKAIELEPNKYKNLILVATSGDTGIAAIEGYKKEKNMLVVVLYPKDGVSEIQKRQMLTASGENVMVLGVDSDFDFCQSVIKNIFNDVTLKDDLQNNYKTVLASANSINWGRLLPQIVYYIVAYLYLVKNEQIVFGEAINVCIPTGNFGNILAAVYASKMGIPIKKFICASNENNVLTEFLQTGKYDLRHRQLIKTSSPSIDILKSSNIERLLYLLSNDYPVEVKNYMDQLNDNNYFEVSAKIKQKLSAMFIADFCTEPDCLATIKNTLITTGELLDPHTAVAKAVADKNNTDTKTLIVATAHWSKFAPAVLQALGGNIASKSVLEIWQEIKKYAPQATVHPQVLNLWEKPLIHHTVCKADKNEIINLIKSFVIIH